MTAERMRALEDKRDRVGLSDAEAEELGRGYASAAGKPYGNHRMLMAAERAPEEGAPEAPRARHGRLRRRVAA